VTKQENLQVSPKSVNAVMKCFMQGLDVMTECKCNTEDDFTCSIHSEHDPLYNDKHPFWKTKEGKKLKNKK
jgi:hypothetical protein